MLAKEDRNRFAHENFLYLLVIKIVKDARSKYIEQIPPRSLSKLICGNEASNARVLEEDIAKVETSADAIDCLLKFLKFVNRPTVRFFGSSFKTVLIVESCNHLKKHYRKFMSEEVAAELSKVIRHSQGKAFIDEEKFRSICEKLKEPCNVQESQHIASTSAS